MSAAIDARPRGDLRRREPLSRHTVWGIGGPADRFYRPVDVDDLTAFVASLPPEEPVFWLGLGSNLLVRDGGVAGTVIATVGVLDRIARTGEREVCAGAGAPCPKVARFCARAGLAGAEFMVGIPGTLGGALAMNAGAFGGETWDIVAEVKTLDRAGHRRTRTPDGYEVGYRSVRGGEGEWFLGARLRLRPEEPESVDTRLRALLRRRGDTQPTGQRSCGSVFRNPPGDHAARLIDACGLKGLRIGDAMVSPKHANFIVNEGRARAADVEALMERIGDAVEREHGVRLVPEVQVVGRLDDPEVRR